MELELCSPNVLSIYVVNYWSITVTGGFRASKPCQTGTLAGLKPRRSGEQTCGDASCTLASSCCVSPPHHPPSDPSSLCFRKALKDTQICRLSESKNRSQHKAVAPEWASDCQREREGSRESHPQRAGHSSGKQKNKNARQTAAHSYTHLRAHAHTRASRSARWPTLLRMENGSQRALARS